MGYIDLRRHLPLRPLLDGLTLATEALNGLLDTLGIVHAQADALVVSEVEFVERGCS